VRSVGAGDLVGGGAQHFVDRGVRGRLLAQRAPGRLAGGRAVQRHDLAEQVLLAAEAGVDAGRGDAHGLGEVVDRRPSVGGATLDASLAATKRVTGRVVVYGVVGGDATISNWDLVYKHQVQVIGLNIGILIQAARQIFGEVMGELFGLVAAGVLGPGKPTIYGLADGPKALAELETRATVGRLTLVP